MTINAIITGMDFLSDGATKIYCLGNEKHTSLDVINRANGSKYCERIGVQCFDVFVSASTFAKYEPLGLSKEKLLEFFENKQLLPFKTASYNGKYFMTFDDFGFAAVLAQSK